jgi:hypothetical protein
MIWISGPAAATAIGADGGFDGNSDGEESNDGDETDGDETDGDASDGDETDGDASDGDRAGDVIPGVDKLNAGRVPVSSGGSTGAGALRTTTSSARVPLAPLKGSARDGTTWATIAAIVCVGSKGSIGVTCAGALGDRNGTAGVMGDCEPRGTVIARRSVGDSSSPVSSSSGSTADGWLAMILIACVDCALDLKGIVGRLVLPEGGSIIASVLRDEVGCAGIAIVAVPTTPLLTLVISSSLGGPQLGREGRAAGVAAKEFTEGATNTV